MLPYINIAFPQKPQSFPQKESKTKALIPYYNVKVLFFYKQLGFFSKAFF